MSLSFTCHINLVLCPSSIYAQLNRQYVYIWTCLHPNTCMYTCSPVSFSWHSMDMWYMCELYWTLLLGHVTHDRCCQCLLVFSCVTMLQWCWLGCCQGRKCLALVNVPEGNNWAVFLTYVLSHCISHFSLQFPQPHSPTSEVHQLTGVAFFKDHPWLHSADLHTWMKSCLMEMGHQTEESDNDPLTGTANLYIYLRVQKGYLPL